LIIEERKISELTDSETSEEIIGHGEKTRLAPQRNPVR
jgi:hypothetical protein